MNPSQAKTILLRHRPGTADDHDPEILEALALAREDPALRHWLEQHHAFQAAMRAKLRALPAPEALKARILAAPARARPPARWRRPAWQMAAALAFLLGLAGLWLWPVTTATPRRFGDFQARMVRTVLREYRMDVRTNDHAAVRRHMANGGAPADYVVPAGLARRVLTGGGLLRWRNQPVSMICFNRGDDEMLFLFVLPRTAVKDPPPAAPQPGRINKLRTASWTQGNNTYLLAGPDEPDFPRYYLEAVPAP